MYGDFNASSNTRNPYIDDTDAHPSWAQFDFHVPTRIDHVLVWCEQPWQSYGTLLDFDLQTWIALPQLLIADERGAEHRAVVASAQAAVGCQHE